MGISKKRCRELYGELVKEYRETHTRCAICWIPDHATEYKRFPPGLQLAHLYAGVNRKDHPSNVAMLCARCHGFQHQGSGRCSGEILPTIDLGVLLAAKLEMGELDCKMLEALTDYKAAWIEEQVSSIPNEYLTERTQWQWN